MLKELTIIELASVLAGPAVGMFLAELGARVIKVENLRTQGDVTRRWKLPSESADTDVSAYFSAINWGKESIALDLKSSVGQDVLHRLVSRADIVISNFIPGAASKLAADSATLMGINPRLICAEINGYGWESSRAAFDAIIQAEAGFTYLNGDHETIHKMPVALMDLLAGHQLKEAILLALIRRMQTGVGERVAVSLLDSGIASLANQATNWLVAGKVPQPKGSSHPNIAPYGTLFQTHDQELLVLAVGTDHQFEQLCQVLNISPLAAWKTNTGRVENREEMESVLRRAISQWNRGELLGILLEKKVPAGAVNDMRQVEKLAADRALLLNSDGLSGLRSMVAAGIERKETLSPPPAYGQHSETILQELGYADETIVEMRANNILT